MIDPGECRAMELADAWPGTQKAMRTTVPKNGGFKSPSKLLWVAGRGGKSGSYLFTAFVLGTIHSLFVESRGLGQLWGRGTPSIHINQIKRSMSVERKIGLRIDQSKQELVPILRHYLSCFSSELILWFCMQNL